MCPSINLSDLLSISVSLHNIFVKNFEDTEILQH